MKQNQQPISDRGAKYRKVRFAGLVVGALALAAGVVGGLQSGWGFGEPAARAQAPAVAHDPTLRLISQSQYVNTIGGVFGADIGIRIRFAPVQRLDGLVAVGASAAVVSGGGLDPLEAASRSIAAQVVEPAHRDLLLPCKPENPRAADPACARAFFSKVVPLLYRRPVSESELTNIVDIAGRSVGKAGDFYDGVAYALSEVLVSPDFLFIREFAEPDPSASGARRLNGYSKASRLSFLLWNSAPDAELLAAAGRGDLHTAVGLRKQVDRMIASPLYKEGVRAFFTDFLVMETFDSLSKDNDIYPSMTLKAVGEAREQTLRTIVDHLVAQKGDYRDLFTTRKTFLSSDLGALYKLSVNIGPQGGWVPYEFPVGDPRAGLLTQIGFLAQYAPTNRSSAVRRGRAVREVLLCQKVPDPPVDVDFTKFEGPKAELATARQRLASHNENPVCAGCHRLTDPIGLALENFDGAGQFRTAEANTAIDPAGDLDGVPFKDAIGLGKALRDREELKTCVTKRLYAYSVGRKVSDEDEALLTKWEATLDKQGYKYDNMLRLIVLDNSFFALKPAKAAKVADADSVPVRTASK